MGLENQKKPDAQKQLQDQLQNLDSHRNTPYVSPSPDQSKRNTEFIKGTLALKNEGRALWKTEKKMDDGSIRVEIRDRESLTPEELSRRDSIDASLSTIKDLQREEEKVRTSGRSASDIAPQIAEIYGKIQSELDKYNTE